MDECKPLERGDSILGGHYSERTFAALLLPTLPAHVVKQLPCVSKGVRRCAYTQGYCGTLYGCNNGFNFAP